MAPPPSQQAPTRRFSNQLKAFCEAGVALADLHEADAILLLAERPLDWSRLQETVGKRTVIIAADSEDQLAGLNEEGGAAGLDPLVLGTSSAAPVYERLTQALLEAVSEDHLDSSATVVTLYSSFDPGVIDSLSLIRLDEHLGRLTVRDLRQLESKVPTETLKLVIDLAVEIGREGREGKPVGTLFVVGDHRKTLEHCKPMGFDPVKGYTTAERNLSDAKVREGVKEIAQMDGAFVVTASGVVAASAQHLSSASTRDITLSKGLGARHWAAAGVSRAVPTSVAVAVSSSSGTVRVFQNGEVVLRIEPLDRAMTWRDFEAESEKEPPAKAKTPSKAKAKSKPAKEKEADSAKPKLPAKPKNDSP